MEQLTTDEKAAVRALEDVMRGLKGEMHSASQERRKILMRGKMREKRLRE